jgi:hypothetical protein
MGNWLKQNGGPLALLVVGLGIAGFRTRYGWAVVGIALVWFIVEEVRRFRSWEPMETAVPGQWVSATYPTDNFREFWLGCRGVGRVFGALRCEVYHPIGRTVVALHRGRVALPRPEREKTLSPWRDFVFAYPDDFSAECGVPAAASGTYQITWLGRKSWSGTTILLTTETHHLQVPPPGSESQLDRPHTAVHEESESEESDAARVHAALELFGLAYDRAREYRDNWAVDDEIVLHLRETLYEVARAAYGRTVAASLDQAMPSRGSFDPTRRGEWVDALRRGLSDFIGRAETFPVAADFDPAEWKPRFL